ncbi:NUDIX domain-containing protein [soil metagenome]
MTDTPRPASTVLVVRDGTEGVEVYLQRRPGQMHFAGGLWVYPGGRVDDADMDAGIDRCWSGPPPSAWAAVMGVETQLARGHVVAAYRETLEESSILLAVGGPSAAEVTDARRALLAGTTTFVEVVRGLDLGLDTALLRYWAWWVTPETEPRRYDTRFFLARLPDDAVITPHDDEVIEETWATDPADDRLTMLPPTYYTMRDVVEQPSVAAAMTHASEHMTTRVEPTLDDDQIVLPWGERYDLKSGPAPRD